MARNAAIFFEIPGAGGRKDDIRCSEYLRNPEVTGMWRRRKRDRLRSAPPELANLHADASQAAAHLSGDGLMGEGYSVLLQR
jgi:hypothetical protein